MQFSMLAKSSKRIKKTDARIHIVTIIVIVIIIFIDAHLVYDTSVCAVFCMSWAFHSTDMISATHEKRSHMSYALFFLV